MNLLYDIFMIPLERIGIKRARKNLIPTATGNVLEIGAGTGANIKYYNKDKLNYVELTDNVIPKGLIKRSSDDIYHITKTDVENLPFDNNQFDTVIHTLVFCSVNDISKGMNEIKRVLKDNGKIIFIEHVLPTKKWMKKGVEVINPLWTKFSHGCTLTRDYIDTLENHGFLVVKQNTFFKTLFVSGVAVNGKIL